jgi:hypothetical protein
MKGNPRFPATINPPEYISEGGYFVQSQNYIFFETS